MANPEHLTRLLEQGVAAWNEWRDQHPDVQSDLSNANLSKADLREVNFADTALARANLRRANLHGANLEDTDLTEVIGLTVEQLAGTNLAGAKLPDVLLKFEGLAIIEETSKNIQQFFLSVLLGCVYSALTIATTTHARLLTNSASSPLPIIGTVIPIVGFYLAVPCLLFGLHVYLHLYLQRLWERLADLPIIFPNERPLDERAYFGPLMSFVRSRFALLRHQHPPLTRLQSWVFVGFSWWVVPFTLLLFWINYLPRRDWVGTALHVGLLAASVGFGVLSYRLASVTLRGQQWYARHNVVSAVMAAGVGLCVALLSLVAIENAPAQRIFALIGCCAANLEDEQVSTKPANWVVDKDNEREMAQQIELVQGARLRESDLRWAKARRAFLAKADLRGANLQGADLFMAQLQGANLSEATLQEANLSWAYLQRADLSGANLQKANLQGARLHQQGNLSRAILQGADLSDAWLLGANFSGADLQHAVLSNAMLKEANLRGALLQQADLSGADLQQADIFHADLQGATGLTSVQIKTAKHWQQAFYRPDLLSALGLPANHNDTLLAERKKNEADLSQEQR